MPEDNFVKQTRYEHSMSTFYQGEFQDVFLIDLNLMTKILHIRLMLPRNENTAMILRKRDGIIRVWIVEFHNLWGPEEAETLFRICSDSATKWLRYFLPKNRLLLFQYVLLSCTLQTWMIIYRFIQEFGDQLLCNSLKRIILRYKSYIAKSTTWKYTIFDLQTYLMFWFNLFSICRKIRGSQRVSDQGPSEGLGSKPGLHAALPLIARKSHWRLRIGCDETGQKQFFNTPFFYWIENYFFNIIECSPVV